MQTTLDLSDELMAAVTARASEEGLTVTSLVEEALRSYLAVECTAAAVEPLRSRGSPDGRVIVWTYRPRRRPCRPRRAGVNMSGAVSG